MEVPSSTLVFLEHVVLVIVVSPILLRSVNQLRTLTKADWLAAAVIGAGSSALATVLFTSAFRYGDPTTPLLLQKVQPLIAVGGAALLLGERPRFRFTWFLTAGLLGAYLLSFRDPVEVSVSALMPALLALGAASLWGLGTVMGRHLTSKLSFSVIASLRFALGLPMLAVLVALSGEPSGLADISRSDVVAIVLLALVPGLLALMVYYEGLQATPASAATLAELAFPVSAVTLNYLVFGTTLSPTQWVGLLLLVLTIVTMTLVSRSNDEESLGIRIAGDVRVRVGRSG